MSLNLSSRVAGLERTMIRKIFEAAPSDAINLGLGQPDLVSGNSVNLAAVRAIAGGQLGYAPTAGLPRLRELIAASYAPFTSDGSEVLVTVGSQEAMWLACLGLCEPGQELLLPDPGYPAYGPVATLSGLSPTRYPLHAQDRFRMRADAIISRLTPQTGAVVLCAPGNPTGACATEGELKKLLPELADRGIPWISDEVYAGLNYLSEASQPWSIVSDGGVVVSSLSKDACMTGWRVGWVAGDAGLVRRLTAAHQYLVTCSPTVSQAAAIGAFSESGREEMRAIHRRFLQRREQTVAQLGEVAGLRVDPPDGGFYCFIDVREWGNSVELAKRILDEFRVITIPGEAFGEQGVGFLRISFAAEESQLKEGVDRIVRALSKR